jgi:hypothetical protein
VRKTSGNGIITRYEGFTATGLPGQKPPLS